MVELNNTEAMLASAEEEEEMVILTALSRQARPHSFHCCTSLSGINSRASISDLNDVCLRYFGPPLSALEPTLAD